MAKIEAVPSSQVGRIVQDPGGKLQRAGSPNTDSGERVRYRKADQEGLDGPAHVGDDGIASGGESCGQQDGFQQPVFLRVSGDAEIGPAEVNSNGKRGLWHGVLSGL